MSRRKSLPSLGEWIGAGGQRFDGNLLGGELRQLDLDQLVAGRKGRRGSGELENFWSRNPFPERSPLPSGPASTIATP